MKPAIDEASFIISEATQMLRSGETSSNIREPLIRSHALLSLCINQSFASVINSDDLSAITSCVNCLATIVDEMDIKSKRATSKLTCGTVEETEKPCQIETTEINSTDREIKKFEDIVGQQAAKQALLENVVYHFTLSDEIKKMLFTGIRAGGGNVLMFGPPGTGKTMLAQATACESMAAFFAVNPSEILSKYQGESEKYMKNLFKKAHTVPRAIIFFDEFDAIAMTRGGADEGAQGRRLLAELLLQLTEWKQKKCTTGGGQVSQVVVIAATNRIEGTDYSIVLIFF